MKISEHCFYIIRKLKEKCNGHNDPAAYMASMQGYYVKKIIYAIELPTCVRTCYMHTLFSYFITCQICGQLLSNTILVYFFLIHCDRN